MRTKQEVFEEFYNYEVKGQQINWLRFVSSLYEAYKEALVMDLGLEDHASTEKSDPHTLPESSEGYVRLKGGR